jgi:hypothetical protein
MEQAGPAAAGHLEEMVDRLGQGAGFGAVATPSAEQAVEATTHGRGRLAWSGVEDPGNLMHPSAAASG